jgi:type I restriction enzyme S subunit
MREGWEYKKLGEVTQVVSCGTPKTSVEEYWGEGHYWVTPAELNDSTIYIDHTERQITDEALAKTKLQVLPKGTVLLSSRAPIGKVAICDVEMYCNQGFKNCICSEVINNKYLFYFLKAKKEYLNSLGRGATFKEISKSIVENVKIPVPPKDTQLSIVSELDKINELIRLKKEQLKDYEVLAQSIFYEMFGDPVENEKGWEVKKLRDVCSKIGSGATPKGGNASYKSEGISLIRSMNVYNNEFNYKDLAFIDEEQAESLANVIIQEHDVLLNITGASVARCCIVPSKVIPARVNQHVCILRSVKDKIEPIYLNRLMTNINFQIHLLSLSRSKAATREALPKSIVDSLPIPLPPLPLQQAFASRIEQIERQKAEVSKQIQDLETLLASRMQYWFE